MIFRLTIAVALILGQPLLAQEEPEQVAIPFEGTQAFSSLLSFFQLQPLPSVAELGKVKPSETLIVVFGETDIVDDIRRQLAGRSGRIESALAKFATEGGAILIASDRPSHGRLADLLVDIDGAQVSSLWAYKGKRQYPFVNKRQNHPIFADVGPIATNGPSFLHSDELGRISTLGLLISAQVPGRPRAGVVPFIMGTLDSDNERVLIIAGHSVFMNGMLGQHDIDNMLFATNCAAWLSSGRRYVFFADSGTIATKLDVPLTVPLKPPLPPVAMVNRLIQKLEEENFLYRYLYGDERWPGVLDGAKVLRGIMLGASLLLLIYVGRRLVNSLQRVDTAVPLPQAWSEQRLEDPAPIVQRHRAVRRLNNYRETAQFLTREFFATLLPADTKFDVVPKIHVNGGWFRSQRWKRTTRELWQLASGATSHVSPAQLRRSLRDMDDLAAAVRTGAVQFG